MKKNERFEILKKLCRSKSLSMILTLWLCTDRCCFFPSGWEMRSLRQVWKCSIITAFVEYSTCFDGWRAHYLIVRRFPGAAHIYLMWQLIPAQSILQFCSLYRYTTFFHFSDNEAKIFVSNFKLTSSDSAILCFVVCMICVDDLLDYK